MRLFEFIL